MLRRSTPSFADATDRSVEVELRLVADVGGTNVRFALADLAGSTPRIYACESFPCAAFEFFEDAVEHFLSRTETRPDSAVIAVAGPIENGEARLTNGRWKFSEAAIVQHGFASAKLINDYVALAMSMEYLTDRDVGTIGPAKTVDHGITVGIVGAGTGLGVAAVVRQGDSAVVAATEGGHMAFAPADEAEIEILRLLTERFGRVSLERVLSGPGLCNLRWALGQMSDVDVDPLPPNEIVRRAMARNDALCVDALNRFCGIYGHAAGDIALTFGARGGMYLGGGIAPRLFDWLCASDFRRRFEAKGRLSGYVADIPTQVILHPYAALLGAANIRIEQHSHVAARLSAGGLGRR
ncbi:MAG: glucokinase [Alphaproteobacteria bacterium]|nr:glucokinase [Alphaproteobacteria bacterium]MDE2501041.1 glucokinase [Alphaproteobacteria bacterium]